MCRHDGQSEQQLIFNQRQQIQRILTHFQHVIALRHRLGIRTFFHHSVITRALDRQSNQFQTTLANHLDVHFKLAVNNHSIALVTRKDELRAHRAGIIGKRITETLQMGQLQLTL
ncbi:hypothetical protein A7D25_05600 [Pseudomonas sp. 21C1]|nr:hypothetical protein A7D25_05600 [Pseudomonas sp. 21C1]